MQKMLLRLILSIPIGWLTSFFCTLSTLFILAMFNQETFRPGSDLSTFWLSIILSISSGFGVLGGFVTASIAKRAEIMHGLGLVILSLAFSIYSMYFTGHSMPNWYRLLGTILIFPTVLFGVWIRIKIFK